GRRRRAREGAGGGATRAARGGGGAVEQLAHEPRRLPHRAGQVAGRPYRRHDRGRLRLSGHARLTSACRYRLNAQNSLPSGSASTCQLTSASGSRSTVAPASTSGATPGTVTSQWMRFFTVLGSGTGTN